MAGARVVGNLMLIECPNCDREVEQQSPPVRGPGSGANDAWLCLKCPATVCCWCYIKHIEAHHPEVYEPNKKPTEGSKKNGKHRK